MLIKEATGKRSRGRVWYVSRGAGHVWHAVQLVRSHRQRRWLCDCQDFFWHKFRIKRHCDHIKAARHHKEYVRAIGIDPLIGASNEPDLKSLLERSLAK